MTGKKDVLKLGKETVTIDFKEAGGRYPFNPLDATKHKDFMVCDPARDYNGIIKRACSVSVEMYPEMAGLLVTDKENNIHYDIAIDCPCDRSDLIELNNDYGSGDLEFLMLLDKEDTTYTHLVSDSGGFYHAIEFGEMGNVDYLIIDNNEGMDIEYSKEHKALVKKWLMDQKKYDFKKDKFLRGDYSVMVYEFEGLLQNKVYYEEADEHERSLLHHLLHEGEKYPKGFVDLIEEIANEIKEENSLDKQKVLSVLNSLEVIESEGGESAYILVEASKDNIEWMNSVGITNEIIDKYKDGDTIDILSLASGEGIAHQYRKGKLVEAIEIEIDEHNYVSFYKLNGMVVMSGEELQGGKWLTALTQVERKKLKEFL